MSFSYELIIITVMIELWILIWMRMEYVANWIVRNYFPPKDILVEIERDNGSTVEFRVDITKKKEVQEFILDAEEGFTVRKGGLKNDRR